MNLMEHKGNVLIPVIAYGDAAGLPVETRTAEYIQQKRIERAKELLSHTNLSIMQIACEIGYNYESSFTKVFKLRENVSPKAYRQGIL